MRAPFRSAQRLTTTAHNVLITLRLEDGSTGYGESAPAAYVTGETQTTALAAARAIAPELVGREEDAISSLLAERLADAPGARGALEFALADARARSAGVPLFLLLGGDAHRAPRLATDLSLPILSPEEAGARAARAAVDGFRTIKIKVGGGDLSEDAARVRAVAAAAPAARLRLDGNQGFTAEEAVRFVEALGDLASRVELLEQPTRAGDDAAMAFVSARVSCPVYADEAVRSVADARRLVGSGACSGVVLKVAKTGLWGTRDVAGATVAAGGRCLFGCMLETRVGIGAAVHLALALGLAVMGLDLDGHLLVDDAALVEGGFRQEGDVLIADPRAPGLGLERV